MKRFIIKLSVIFCLVLKCVPAQTTAITPPTHDDQITMSLIVTDDHNHQVENISQADLQVIEDGKPLKVLGLERDLRPVMYTIAIDVSGSFQTSIRRSLQLARGFIENNRPEDETMLVSFVGSDRIETVQEFTRDKVKLLKGVEALYVGGGQTAFIDAAYLTIEATAKYRTGSSDVRRAVLLFSDGEDRASYYGADDLKKLLHETDVQVFILGNVKELSDEPGLGRQSPREGAERLLQMLAAESGGRVFLPKTTAEVIAAAQEINSSLSSQYVLTFGRAAKPGKKGFQKVRVSLVQAPKTDKLIAITRPGYFIGRREPAKKH